MPSKPRNPPDPANLELFENTPFKIGELKGYMALVSVKRILNARYGEGNWGMKEAADERMASVRRKADTIEEDRAERKEVTTKHKRGVQSRVDEYLRAFKDVTPNDVQSITQMCNLEVQMQGIDGELLEANLKVDDRKKLGDLYAKLSAEHRQLQTALGIIRSGRESEMDTASEIKKFISGARKKIEDEGIMIACPHCQEKIALNQGFVMFHFKTNMPWRWQSKCPNPKCGKWFELKSEGFEESIIADTESKLAIVPF